jgi:hypothetical protein
LGVEEIRRIGRIVEDSDTAKCGHGLFEQLQQFPGCLCGKSDNPRDVSAGTGQALDQACLDRVGRTTRYNNGDRHGRMLGSQDMRVTVRNDDVDFETDEFGRQLWEEGYVPFRMAVLQDDVLPIHVPQLTQALLKGFVLGLPIESLRTPGENPDAIDFPRLLRGGCEGCQKDGKDKRHSEPDSFGPHSDLLVCPGTPG